jgi:hypothetical protein
VNYELFNIQGTKKPVHQVRPAIKNGCPTVKVEAAVRIKGFLASFRRLLISLDLFLQWCHGDAS